MFSGAKAELPRVRAQARSAERLAKSFEAAARKAKPASTPDISAFKVALAKIEFMTSECDRVLDSLYFENDEGERYQRIIDGLEEPHSDIESAIEDIEDTARGIESGDYAEFWVPRTTKKKTTPKPRKNSHSFEIEYQDRDGVITIRKISKARVSVRDGYYLITAHCSLRNDERSFMSTRIRSCRDAETGRAIDDLGRHLLNST